jgi:hypothetical protein
MWVLHASTPIQVVFESLFTEEVDVLTVQTASGETLAEVSGTALPSPIATNETTLVITFTSNVYYFFAGFELFAIARTPDGTWAPIAAPTSIADPRTPSAPLGSACSSGLLIKMRACSRARRRHVPV